MIPTLLLISIAAVLYLTVGLAAFRTAERRNWEGEHWRLIYSWPLVALVVVLILALVLPTINDVLSET